MEYGYEQPHRAAVSEGVEVKGVALRDSVPAVWVDGGGSRGAPRPHYRGLCTFGLRALLAWAGAAASDLAAHRHSSAYV